MDIKEAFKRLNVNKFLADMKKEATKELQRGLIEGGMKMCEAIKAIEKWLENNEQ